MLIYQQILIGMPAVDESEAPSEVHSEGESYVLSPIVIRHLVQLVGQMG